MNPIKALTSAFLDGISKELGSPKHSKFVLLSRHHPVVFDDVLQIFNDFGLLLPVTAEMKDTMPFVCDLLRLNTASANCMQDYLSSGKYDGIKVGNNKEAFFYDENLAEPQFSNVGMAISIIIFLLNNKPELNENIVRWNLEGYKQFFSLHRCFGLNKDVYPEYTQTDIAEYSELLHMQFCHPLVKDPLYKFSLSDVIYGLLYGSERPDEFQIPERSVGACLPGSVPIVPIEFRVTKGERKLLNDHLSINFCPARDYYGIIGNTIEKSSITQEIDTAPLDVTIATAAEVPPQRIQQQSSWARKGSRYIQRVEQTTTRKRPNTKTTPRVPASATNVARTGKTLPVQRNQGKEKRKRMGAVATEPSAKRNKSSKKKSSSNAESNTVPESQLVLESDIEVNLCYSEMTDQITKKFLKLQKLVLLRAAYKRTAAEFKKPETPPDATVIIQNSYLAKEVQSDPDNVESDKEMLIVIKHLAALHVSRQVASTAPVLKDRVRDYYDTSINNYATYDHHEINDLIKMSTLTISSNSSRIGTPTFSVAAAAPVPAQTTALLSQSHLHHVSAMITATPNLTPIPPTPGLAHTTPLVLGHFPNIDVSVTGTAAIPSATPAANATDAVAAAEKDSADDDVPAASPDPAVDDAHAPATVVVAPATVAATYATDSVAATLAHPRALSATASPETDFTRALTTNAAARATDATANAIDAVAVALDDPLADYAPAPATDVATPATAVATQALAAIPADPPALSASASPAPALAQVAAETPGTRHKNIRDIVTGTFAPSIAAAASVYADVDADAGADIDRPPPKRVLLKNNYMRGNLYV